MTESDDCSCQDYGVSRRSLLKAAGLASMAGVATSMFGEVMTSTVYGAGDRRTVGYVANDHPQPCMADTELGGCAHECGHGVVLCQSLVNQQPSGPAGGTEDQKVH